MRIYAIGGYNQIGGNMSCVEVGDDAIIMDMGIYLDPYIKLTEASEDQSFTVDQLREAQAIPDDTVINHIKHKVRAICPSHAHLDHVGSIIYLSNKYDAPIVCTPFTAEVIKTIAQNERMNLKNKIIAIALNGTYRIHKELSVEFVHVTHSTPHTAMVCIHTKEGRVLYANDFKFDDHPQIGRKPNYDRLRKLGEEGIDVLICDSTRALKAGKTPSEAVAKQMLQDVMLGVESDGRAIIVSTFSSHIARLKSILDCAHKIKRKVVFLGRSLWKYTQSAENIKLVDFSSRAEIVKYGKHIRRRLKQIQQEGPEKYVLIVTGHQAEPQATLTKMVNKELSFRFKPKDIVIFSCTVIPTDENKVNRRRMEDELKHQGVRIFADIHASGHASREDLRDLLLMTKPKHVFPAHGELEMRMALANLAIEEGYVMGKSIHILHNGQHERI